MQELLVVDDVFFEERESSEYVHVSPHRRDAPFGVFHSDFEDEELTLSLTLSLTTSLIVTLSLSETTTLRAPLGTRSSP